MSLINEALKRAKHAQKKDAAPPLASSAALRPTDPARRGNYNPINLLLLAFVALVAVCGCIIWIVLRSGVVLSAPQTVQARFAPRPVAAPSKTESRPTISQHVAAPSQPVVQASPTVALATDSVTPVSASARPTPVESLTTFTATPTTSQQVAVASAPPPPPPMPKLQGIFYRPLRPAALINGKMVSIGRAIGDYRVVDISQESVTVVRAGQTNVLKMPD